MKDFKIDFDFSVYNDGMRELMKCQDEEIIKVLKGFLGESVNIDELKSRCNIIINVYGEEIFRLDGIPLIKFGKLKVKTITEDNMIKMTAYRDVVHLGSKHNG